MKTGLIRVYGSEKLHVKGQGVGFKEGWLRSALPAGTHLERAQDGQGRFMHWLIAANHLDRLIEEMLIQRKVDRVEVWSIHNREQGCNDSCMTAKRTLCECSCGGVHHKSGGTDRGWLDGDVERTVWRDEETEWVVRTYTEFTTTEGRERRERDERQRKLLEQLWSRA